MKTKLRLCLLVCARFNKIAPELAKTLPNSHVISSAGCTSNDRLHFNSAGSREFGKRYGEKMLSLLGYKAPVKNQP